MSHHDSSCPSCGKIFKDHTSIARHMSQPWSGCNTWLEDMINPILFGEDHNMDSVDDEDITGLPHNIDSFLSLEMIKDLPLSFRSARELHGRAEMLPSGPCWKSQVIHTSHPTKLPVILYWHDPIEYLTPHKIHSTVERLCRVYTRWISGNDAWDMQLVIPKGATLLDTILSSDKTNITALTGDCIAHPLLISLPNIYVNCLNIVLELLKQSAQHGVMLSDPIGCSRYCFTALMSYISNTPEAMMLAAVGGKMSPVTMAMYKQFGDVFHHEPRTKSTTSAQLAVKFRLNGIDKPFWWDYALADPSRFLTPESLHHLHKEFFDHDTQWLICAVGDSEIDFRFSVLQPITEIQCYIIAISADAAPPHVIAAVHALMQFWYLIQSPHIDEEDLGHISGALTEFHMNKDAILAAGARQGKGNRNIDNFYIPKLELMQSIVPSICNSGFIGQWSADITEHAHITEIKDPTRSSNNNNYNTQIC
ncbi:uncharacterized protein HD556DRAFT_1443963 [Suillus plorans]|uniref:C2H2-type domain-containing protein n=1 Tax=Suillus plorans TaxID=116603 RepID=A0A9P7AMY9_9AGAM|nr:uncharacterized protein HD556DRAFT_1443963 [Suillus plorans]KAG1792878.1 hypothetical protein HD556DRAFT_1443963 [Suillus plorans]